MNGLNTWTEFLLNAGAKSVCLMAVLVAAMFTWRRGAAASRHFLWLTGLLALLVLPLTTLLPRPWPRPAWTQKADFMNQWMDNLSILPANLSGSPQSRNPATSPVLQKSAAGADGTTRPAIVNWRLRVRTFVFVTWVMGLGVLCARSMVRLMALAKLQRCSLEWDESGCREALDAQKEALGVRRAIRLLRAKEPLMPMTWGWWRPVLLLPPDADKWEPTRLRLVLRHELAHVKRWDCLTQGLAHVACALYWFNPLVWFAARQVRLERERACDDLVVNRCGLPSEYAQHLLQIAQQFAFVPRVAAIPIAKPSTLENRLLSIVDASRQHGRLHPAVALLAICVIGGFVFALGGFRTRADDQESKASELLRQEQLARVQAFSIAKEKQSRVLAAKAGEEFLPDYQRLFDAATNGNWQVVTNLYEDFKRRHAQYGHSAGKSDELPHTSYWSPVLEICLAYWEMANGEPKYTQIFVDDVINSIPPGSIYFGGTDPGRGLITAFSKSHADADPFFTVTQNALADGSYLDYVRAIYGAKIYTPTADDSQNCFNEYLADAEHRLKENKLKPGEDVKKAEDGHIQVQGQVAVMSINGLLAKIIFDKNPDREFYIEESFPLEWMYPHLEPHGLIMKINREPMSEIPQEVLQRDREYWNQRVQEMLGDWLTEQTSVQSAVDFIEKVYLRHDMSGFKGDPRFIDDVPRRIFSKLRSSIGGVYAWRKEHSSNESEKSRMAQAADHTLKQAWALCPYSPEAVFRYVNLLETEKRRSDALLLAQTASRLSAASGGRDTGQFQDLLERLKSK